MSGELIHLSTAMGTKRPFVFYEGCPACGCMTSPFIVTGRSTGRFRCEGGPSADKRHEPVHWQESKEQFTPIVPGHDLPSLLNAFIGKGTVQGSE